MSRLKSGTKYFKSVVGHNNFFYPEYEQPYATREDCEVRQLNYVGGGKLSAVLIPKSATKKNHIGPEHEGVWVEPDDIG